MGASKWLTLHLEREAEKREIHPIREPSKPPKPRKAGSGGFGGSLIKEIDEKNRPPRKPCELVKTTLEQLAILPTIATPDEAQDWKDLYTERAAIAEHDGGLSRAEAERQAHECCIAAWLNSNADITENIECPACGEPVDDACLPILTATSARTWVHERCHEPWSAERRERAERAIREILDHHAGQPTNFQMFRTNAARGLMGFATRSRARGR